MAAWRRIALETFPELRYDIVQSRNSYYSIFGSLRSMLETACAASDQDTVRRIFGFGRWCLQQERRAPDLWNAAVTAFYEHIFDDCRNVDLLLPHLTAEDIANGWDLWRFFTPPEVWDNVETRLRSAFPNGPDATGSLHWTLGEGNRE